MAREWRIEGHIEIPRFLGLPSFVQEFQRKVHVIDGCVKPTVRNFPRLTIKAANVLSPEK